MKLSEREKEEIVMRKMCYLAATVDFYFMYGTEDEYMDMDTLLKFGEKYFGNIDGINNNVLIRMIVEYMNEYCLASYYEVDWVEMCIHCKKMAV